MDMTFHDTIAVRKLERGLHGGFVSLNAFPKADEFWDLALANLVKPGIQLLPCSVMHHAEECLHQVICCFQSRMNSF